jgi:hypothetical protein
MVTCPLLVMRILTPTGKNITRGQASSGDRRPATPMPRLPFADAPFHLVTSFEVPRAAGRHHDPYRLR